MRGATSQDNRRLPPAAFQLTHLLRGATFSSGVLLTRPMSFQLTHLLRGATVINVSVISPNIISTHAPLARCDTFPNAAYWMIGNFNSRTSCEVRRSRCNCAVSRRLFQLTHLLRGATYCFYWGKLCFHFNSRTSCEVRPNRLRKAKYIQPISTHAPLARCDIS